MYCNMLVILLIFNIQIKILKFAKKTPTVLLNFSACVRPSECVRVRMCACTYVEGRGQMFCTGAHHHNILSDLNISMHRSKARCFKGSLRHMEPASGLLTPHKRKILPLASSTFQCRCSFLVRCTLPAKSH